VIKKISLGQSHIIKKNSRNQITNDPFSKNRTVTLKENELIKLFYASFHILVSHNKLTVTSCTFLTWIISLAQAKLNLFCFQIICLYIEIIESYQSQVGPSKFGRSTYKKLKWTSLRKGSGLYAVTADLTVRSWLDVPDWKKIWSESMTALNTSS
jgi:hypothetical protein